MSRKPPKSYLFDHRSPNKSDDLFKFVMVFAEAAVAIDTVGAPSRFSAYGFGFEAPSEAELNEVWGEPEFDFTHYIVADRPDQLI